MVVIDVFDHEILFIVRRLGEIIHIRSLGQSPFQKNDINFNVFFS